MTAAAARRIKREAYEPWSPTCATRGGSHCHDQPDDPAALLLRAVHRAPRPGRRAVASRTCKRAGQPTPRRWQRTSQERIAATQEEYQRLQRRYARAVPGGDADDAKRLGAELAAIADKPDRLERERSRRNPWRRTPADSESRLENFIKSAYMPAPQRPRLAAAVTVDPRGATARASATPSCGSAPTSPDPR